MHLVRYTLCDIDLMMVDIEGTLYCSTPQLEKVFGLDDSNLSKLVRNYPEEFSKATCEILTRYNVPPKEVRDGLMLKRLRKNTRLWSEDDLIGITWLVRSDIARKFRAQFKKILKEHASMGYVSKEAHLNLLAAHTELAAQVGPLMSAVSSLQEEVGDLRAQNSQMASNAGRSLRLVKG